jgi:hypothetical protein
VVSASLRQARAVALASGCDVQFTINAAGYTALQRARNSATNHCADFGGFSTPVLNGARPSKVVLASPRVFVFSKDNGNIGAATTINLGAQLITVNGSGVVQ